MFDVEEKSVLIRVYKFTVRHHVRDRREDYNKQ